MHLCASCSSGAWRGRMGAATQRKPAACNVLAGMCMRLGMRLFCAVHQNTRMRMFCVCVCVYVAGWVGAVQCARERVPDTKCSFDACIRVPAAHLVDVMDTAAALLRAASVHMLSSVCRCWPPCMCLRALCVRERGHVRVHRPFEFRRPCALSSTIFALFDVPTSFTGRSGL